MDEGNVNVDVFEVEGFLEGCVFIVDYYDFFVFEEWVVVGCIVRNVFFCKFFFY